MRCGVQVKFWSVQVHVKSISDTTIIAGDTQKIDKINEILSYAANSRVQIYSRTFPCFP